MTVVLRILFLPLTPFIGHPERAWLVAGLFAILLILLARVRPGRLWRLLPILLAAFAWGGFGHLEQVAIAHGWNIRVDLLLITPILLVVTTWASWAAISLATRRGGDDPKGDQSPGETTADGNRPGGSAIS